MQATPTSNSKAAVPGSDKGTSKGHVSSILGRENKLETGPQPDATSRRASDDPGNASKEMCTKWEVAQSR